MTSSSLSNASRTSAASHASSQAEDNEPKFPDRKQDLDHRELEKYMEEHKVREILTEIMAYLVENRCDDPIQGSIDFLKEYKPK